MVLSKKCSFILSCLSAIVLQLGTSSLVSLGNFNVYIASYIHHAEGQAYVNIQYGNLIAPILTFAMTCFGPIAGIIESRIGPKNTILIGELILLLFLGLFLIQRNIWICFILCFGFGLGNSIMAFIPIKNACFYYPKYKALIPACLSSIGMIFGAAYNIIGEMIVNPGHEVIENNVYSEYISARIRIYLVVIAMSSSVGTLFSYFLLIPYNPAFDDISNNLLEKEKEEEDRVKKEEEKAGIMNSEISQEGSSEQLTITNKADKKTRNLNYKKDIKKAMSNYRIWLIASFATFAGFAPGFVLNTFRAFVSLTQTDPEDGEIIQFLGSFILICLCFFSPLWGIGFDKLGFRPIIVTVTGLGIINSIGLMLFLNNKFIYRILLCTSGIMIAGLLTSINPHVMGVYGIKYTLELNGIIGIFSGISSLAGAVTSFIFGLFWTTGKEIIFPYRIVFTVGSVLSFASFILQWFEPIDEFVFDETEKEVKEVEEGRLTTSSSISNLS